MRIVSLFSGAGGFDIGMIQAGHQVIWANDNDADACETYRRNIGSHVLCKDIAEVSSAEIPACDVVIGGFPCQGFSMANMMRSVDDDRNKLYRHFRRVVRDKRPSYFLAENVRGILSLGGGEVIKKIVGDFSRVGYRVQVQCFNTADFGVPQTRIRVIIAGTRRDLPADLDFQFPAKTHERTAWISIAEALKGIPEPTLPSHGLSNHIFSKYKVTDRNFTGHRLTNPNKPSPTILARGNGRGGVCAIQHPANHRRMSVRECATVQTFPEDFTLVGTMGSMYRQVGNAVPVLFARHLGMKLRELERVRR